MFFRCLATLFDSSVPLVRSFELLAQQTEHKALAQASGQVAKLLAQGQNPAEAMRRYPYCFTPLQIALVRVGQHSGALSQVFRQLAVDEEQRYALRQRLRSSLVVPLFISGTCVLLLTLVAPLVLGSVIQQLGMNSAQMPWATQVLVVVSDLLRNPVFWISSAIATGLGVRAWGRWQEEDTGRLQLARALDRIPGLGWVLRLGASTQFLRTLETTLAVGFPLLDSLKMAGDASAHPMLQAALPTIVDAIKEGEELDIALQRSDFFPTLVPQGVRAGQEAGSLVKMLRHLAKILQLNLDHACETFSVALEPVIIGFVGLVVGFCVVATLLPMVKLVEVL